MSIELNRAWTEFLSLLISRRVRFVLVGGHAVAAHGEPRLTEDLDVFVRPEAENVERLRRALKAVWDDPEIDKIDRTTGQTQGACTGVDHVQSVHGSEPFRNVRERDAGA